MNNSDFLSEAVALDLGKSGVKVAETLEIEVGEEWWRLINAADVMDVTRYNYRKLADPVVVDGVLNLAPFGSKSIPMLSQFRMGVTSNTLAAQFPMGVFCTSDDITTNIIGATTWTYTGSHQIHSSIRFGNVFQNIIGSRDATLSGSNADAIFEVCSIWDSINNRFVFSYTDSSNTRYIGLSFTSLDGTWNTSNIGNTYVDVALISLLLDVKCFSQLPSIVYKVYRDASGDLWVDFISLISGETLLNFRNRLYGISANAVKISVAAGSTGSAGVFYSRWHGSVGVLWRDGGTGVCSYALESEGWATVHALPNFLMSNHTITPKSIGTLAIPNNGEFLVIGTEKTQKGVISKETPGYSYPANLQIIGTGYIGDDKSVIMGIVGSTLYRYLVDLKTMQILNKTSVDTGSILGNAPNISHAAINLRLIHRSAYCEYWVLEGYDNLTYITRASSPKSLLAFTLTGTLKWGIDISGTTDIFPAKAPGTNSSKSVNKYPANWGSYVQIQNLGNTHLFIGQSYALPRLLYFTIPFSVLDSCTNKADVLGNIPSFLSYDSRVFGLTPLPADTCLKDMDNYYLYHYDASTSNKLLTVIDKVTKEIINVRLTRYDDVRPAEVFATKWVAPGYFEYDFSTNNDLLAISNARSPINKIAFTAFKPTLANGTIREEISESIATAARYNKIRTNKYILPNNIISMPLKNDKNPVWCIVGEGVTALGFLGVDTTSYTKLGIFSNLYDLSFTHRRFILNPETEEIWSISNIIDDNIHYEKFRYAGKEREDFAIDVSGEVARINYGNIPGGIQDIRSTGNIMAAISGGGSNWLFETGASPTEGEGGTPPSGGEGAILYTYVSQNFTPYPFAREGIRAELSNISKTTKITLPETRTNLIRGLLASGTDFRGSRCILRRIFPDHADTTGSDIVLLDGYIQDWSYVPGKKGIAFTVSKTLIDVGAQFPKRLMNMGCSHVFKGERCKYLGETGRCLKTKAFCQFLNNQNQFGGFPWVAARQRRVMWR